MCFLSFFFFFFFVAFLLCGCCFWDQGLGLIEIVTAMEMCLCVGVVVTVVLN